MDPKDIAEDELKNQRSSEGRQRYRRKLLGHTKGIVGWTLVAQAGVVR